MEDWNDHRNRLLGIAMKTFGGKDPVTYTPVSGAPVSIMGVFNEAYQPIDNATGLPLSSTQPALGVRLSDLPAAPRKGDKATIKTKTYKVMDSHPDGGGGAILLLHET